MITFEEYNHGLKQRMVGIKQKYPRHWVQVRALDIVVGGLYQFRYDNWKWNGILVGFLLPELESLAIEFTDLKQRIKTIDSQADIIVDIKWIREQANFDQDHFFIFPPESVELIEHDQLSQDDRFETETGLF